MPFKVYKKNRRLHRHRVLDRNTIKLRINTLQTIT